MDNAKRQRSWLGIFSDALATFTLEPGRPPMPMSESFPLPESMCNLRLKFNPEFKARPRVQPRTREENIQRDCEALAGDWRRVGQDIWKAVDSVMAGNK